MGTVTVGQENTNPIELYYEDLGSGPTTVALLHGWPLDSRSWEPQLHALLAAGHRVIVYDRRGFGRSSRPSVGYDFDTLAHDLDALLTQLDLRGVTLIGFSLGTGELARYVGMYGTERLRGCGFIETLAPSFVESDENPWGGRRSWCCRQFAVHEPGRYRAPQRVVGRGLGERSHRHRALRDGHLCRLLTGQVSSELVVELLLRDVGVQSTGSQRHREQRLGEG